MTKKKAESVSFYKRYKDVVLLIIGFVLTGVVGTTITYLYQNHQQQLALQVEQKRIDRQEAYTAASEISELVGKHHFNALQLRGSIESYIQQPTPDNLSFMNEQSSAYRAGVREWNTEWNKNRTRVRMLFGSDFEGRFYTHADISKEKYEQSLTGLFNEMHIELVAAKAVALSNDRSKGYDFTRFDEKYHAIGYVSYELYNDMIAKIQKGEVGTFNKNQLENLAPTYVFPTATVD